MLSSVSQRLSAKTQAARGSVAARATARPTWCPGAPVPAHLDGSLTADYGFDPLNLGADPKALRWYVHSEIFHGRLAMSAVAGILIPGLMTKAGILNVPEWYEAGKVAISEGGPASFADLKTHIIVTFFATHFVEVKRYQDFLKPKSQGEAGSFVGLEAGLAGTGENAYPGGLFDPMGFAKDSGKLADYKLKELKNGRLAMMAILGFASQYIATGKGPVDNLFDHLKDPWHTTFADNAVSLPGIFTL